MNKQLIDLNDRKAFGLSTLSKVLDVSVPFLRNEIRDGNLKAKKLGTRTVVTAQSVDAYLEAADDWTGESRDSKA